MAVGGQGTPLAETWNGSSWTGVAVPLPANSNGGQLFGVSCLSSTDCTAIGYHNESTGPDVTLAEHWDGVSWTIDTSPNPPGAVSTGLTEVSCTATACTAVGTYQNGLNLGETLVERYQ
jgi:hypothetical protein